MSMILNPYRYAGAGGSFSPLDISGLDLWLDASDSSTLYDTAVGGSLVADDGEILRWEDKSGNDNHAVEYLTYSGPRRRVSEVNSLDAVDFNGTDEYLRGGLLGPRQESEKTAFMVALWDGATGFVGGSIFILYDSPSFGSAGNITGEIAYRTNNRTWISSTQASASGSVVTLSQSGSGNIHDVIAMYLDGTSITRTSGTNGALVNDGNSYGLGGVVAGATDFFGDGKICEVIVYDSELSTANREAVETYLGSKWGITITH